MQHTPTTTTPSGKACSPEGRPDLAAGYYTKALEVRPGYPEAYYNLAQTFLDRGQAVLEVRPLVSQFDDWLGDRRAVAWLSWSIAVYARSWSW